MESGIIVHPAKTRFITIREDYLGICTPETDPAPNPRCAAALLSVIEHWNDYKWQERQLVINKNVARVADGLQPFPVPSLWIYMTQGAWQAELMGLFGEKAIPPAFEWLITARFIARRRNRVILRDRTFQYLFRSNMVQAAVDSWASSPHAPNRVRTIHHSAKVRNAKRKIADSIPQKRGSITTRVFSQDSDTDDKNKAFVVVLQAYEKEIGLLTPMIGDDLKAAVQDYPVNWITEAIHIASTANKRSWRYVLGILRRWKVEGYGGNQPPAAAGEPPAGAGARPEYQPFTEPGVGSGEEISESERAEMLAQARRALNQGE